jgi:hypothetical protein
MYPSKRIFMVDIKYAEEYNKIQNIFMFFRIHRKKLHNITSQDLS